MVVMTPITKTLEVLRHGEVMEVLTRGKFKSHNVHQLHGSHSPSHTAHPEPTPGTQKTDPSADRLPPSMIKIKNSEAMKNDSRLHLTCTLPKVHDNVRIHCVRPKIRLEQRHDPACSKPVCLPESPTSRSGCLEEEHHSWYPQDLCSPGGPCLSRLGASRLVSLC